MTEALKISLPMDTGIKEYCRTQNNGAIVSLKGLNDISDLYSVVKGLEMSRYGSRQAMFLLDRKNYDGLLDLFSMIMISGLDPKIVDLGNKVVGVRLAGYDLRFGLYDGCFGPIVGVGNSVVIKIVEDEKA